VRRKEGGSDCDVLDADLDCPSADVVYSTGTGGKRSHRIMESLATARALHEVPRLLNETLPLT
jgi:hypothetical protein